jgi:hypothetical protein
MTIIRRRDDCYQKQLSGKAKRQQGIEATSVELKNIEPQNAEF